MTQIGEDIAQATHGIVAEIGQTGQQHLPVGTASEAIFLRTYRPGDMPSPGSMPFGDVNVDGPWHYHDTHQLMFVFEGGVQTESENGRYLIPRQLAAWIPAGIRHRMNLHNVRAGSVFFPRAMVEQAGDRIRVLIVSPLMREMVKESVRWPLHGRDSAHRTAFFASMAHFCNEWIDDEADLFMPISGNARLEGALQYTAEHIDQKLPEICRHAGMSERSFRRHLNAAYGMNWEQYRNRIRLMRAVTLLGETSLPIDEVALRCGFESPSGFSRVFRSMMNQAPREYRNHIKAS